MVLLTCVVESVSLFDGRKELVVDVDSLDQLKSDFQRSLRFSDDFHLLMYDEVTKDWRLVQTWEDIDSTQPVFQLLPIPAKVLRKKKKKTGALSDMEKLRRLEQGWRGSPSSFRGLTFSRTTNRRVINKQDVPDLFDDQMRMKLAQENGHLPEVPRPEKPKKKKVKKVPHIMMLSPIRKSYLSKEEREDLESGWQGSPSSFKKFCFSRTVNRRLTNKQDIPDYDASEAYGGLFLPVFLRSSAARKRPSTTNPLKRKQLRSRQSARKKEMLWQGSPSSFKTFSFSSTSNLNVVNKQDIPQYTSYLDPKCPLALKKSFQKNLSLMESAQQHETSVMMRQRQRSVREKDKRGVLPNHCERLVRRVEESLREEQELEKLLNTLAKFDSNREGTIPLSAFVKGMHDMGFTVSKFEMQDVAACLSAIDLEEGLEALSSLDLDSDPRIRYSDFYDMLTKRRDTKIRNRLLVERELGLIE